MSVIIVGFPTISRLIRGLCVDVGDGNVLIPDDTLFNESVKMSGVVTAEELTPKAAVSANPAQNMPRAEICAACDPEYCDVTAVYEAGGRYCCECGRKLSPVG